MNDAHWIDFIQYGFYGLMSFVGSYGVILLHGMRDSMDEVREEVAGMKEGKKWVEREIDAHERRICRLEQVNN